MDDSAPLMHVDWIRWFQNIANAVSQPLTPGMIPNIPFIKIEMTLSPRLLGRTTAGAGSAELITVSSPLTLSAGALGLSTPLTAVFGGTGFASYAVGDVLYADTTTTLAKRTIGSAADVLTVTGGVPVWAAPAAAATSVIVDDTTTNATMFPTWVTASSGSLPLKVSSTKLFFNPSTGVLTDSVPGIAATSSDGIVLQNPTAATAGVPVQMSPRLRFRSNVWNTTTPANNTQDWYIDSLPVSGLSPTAALRTFLVLNGAVSLSRWTLFGGAVAGAAPSARAEILNNDNTSGTSNAQIAAVVGGGSGGDPSLSLGISGTINWSVGIDNSDSDKLKIGPNILVGTSTALTIDATTLNVGLQVASPTATLHLKAGTTAASTAPFKFTSGALNTTAEAMAVEALTDNLHFTITTGAARKGIVLDDGTRLTSGNVPVATTNGRLIDGPTLANVIVTKGSGRSIAQVAAVASVATYTLAAADASFIVDANINVTTSTTHNFTAECAYTDETNTAQVLTLTFSQLTGIFVTAITNVTGAGPYEGVPMHIRCKASTAITIRTQAAGTYTAVVFNVEGSIRQVAA